MARRIGAARRAWVEARKRLRHERGRPAARWQEEVVWRHTRTVSGANEVTGRRRWNLRSVGRRRAGAGYESERQTLKVPSRLRERADAESRHCLTSGISGERSESAVCRG